MRIKINGEERDFDPGLTVYDLLEVLGIDLRAVAIERNAEVIPRSAFAATRLAEDDEIEIVSFVGGG